MNGFDPWVFMQDLVGRNDAMRGRAQVERALDDLEYLVEVMDPELPDPAYALADRLRAKLERGDQ